MIAGAYNLVRDGYAAQIDFKGADGWVSLTADEMTAIAVVVGRHVQACFSHEAALARLILAIDPASPTADSELDSVDINVGWPV